MAVRASVNLKGCLARVALNKKNVYGRHKLDTEIDKYYKTLHNVVIPEFMDMVKEIPGYPQRIKKCISHTTPAYYDGWNFSIELMYKTVADEHHQTEKNLEKCRILRTLMDVNYAMSSIIDDYVDKGEYRHGKKIWASICEGGQEAAIYDSISVHYLILLMLHRHFRNDPGYSRLLELHSTVRGRGAIGNTLDILDRKENFDDNTLWKHSVQNKAANMVYPAAVTGLVHESNLLDVLFTIRQDNFKSGLFLHIWKRKHEIPAGVQAGVLSEELHDKTREVFGYAGHLLQVWDDLMEYYASEEQSGKGSPDSKCNIKSWATVTAMAHFNEAQAKEFRACYGSSDPAKRTRVHELYQEVNLPRLYLDYLRKIYMVSREIISKIPDPRIRSACTSYMDWLLLEPAQDDEESESVLNN